MIKPRALKAGDRVAILAPASPFKREEFDRGVAEIERLGFTPVYDESVFQRDRYLAGPAADRAHAIQAAWKDPSIAGLIAVRGGYGSAQVLPGLDREAARRARKAFVGYSDLTALLTFLSVQCGLVAFHGPMLDRRLGRGAAGYDERTFLAALTSPEPLGELSAPAVEIVREGEATGPLLGGTLTQLVASLGTPFAFDLPPRGILFLDEVGERPYRLDRMITQLAQAGILARAAGVVIGELPDCDETPGEGTHVPLAGRSVVADLFRDFPGPVLIGFPSGHTVGPALTLPFGVASRVVARGRPRLVIEEAAVA
jgi:muramoyltetrapeptide carboxypeptidase